MPKLGYDMTVGIIAAWLVEVGDQITRGQAIAEIETDKVVIEMEALASGNLLEIVHGPDDEVEVGAIIGYMEDGT